MPAGHVIAKRRASDRLDVMTFARIVELTSQRMLNYLGRGSHNVRIIQRRVSGAVKKDAANRVRRSNSFRCVLLQVYYLRWSPLVAGNLKLSQSVYGCTQFVQTAEVCGECGC